MTKRSRPLNPRKEPTQARSRQTVSDILEAGAQVFAERGYAGATTTRVAQRAGVSVGSLYQYFPNKDSLLVALSARHVRRAHDAIERALDRFDFGPAEPLPALAERLHALVDAMLVSHQDEPVLHRVLFEESPRRPQVDELEREREAALGARFVALLRAHPEVRVPDLELAATLAAQTMESLCHEYVLHERPRVPPERFAAEVTEVLHRYLGGR